jgi:uncharacterized protein (TIGR03437 family)
MKSPAGLVCIVLAGLLGASAISAQSITNQSLNGNYFFRYVSIGSDSSGNATDPRSLLGTMTFDGAGHYTFNGEEVIGGAAAASDSGAGTYSVDPAGNVSIASPIRTGDTVNARLSVEALIGSGAETTDNTFDLLVAIPAPTTAVALTGPYWVVTLEFPGGLVANARNTFFSMNSGGIGQLAAISVYGHAATIASGEPTTQQLTGATYTVPSSGAGTLQFGTASTSLLLSGAKNVYLSADGNMLIGGSTAAGSHDIMIGVKAIANPTASSWNGTMWTSGLRYESATGQPAWIGNVGSLAARLAGSNTIYQRLKALGQGTTDFTAVNPYSLNAGGSLTVQLSQVGLGAGGTFVEAAIDPSDPGGFEIDIGVPWMPESGSGVFLDPRGVVSAASFAPSGNPISPGEFIALFGAGLAKSTLTASPPYSATLNSVTVLINGRAAPIYFVSAGQINCLVPYSTTGATATIVVQNGTANSNTVTVPVAVTSPGVFSLDQSGTGSGAIVHSATGEVVNAANPAVPGEIVLVYLTGMGAVSPSIADGAASTGSPLNKTVAVPTLYIADQQASVGFSGLAPGFPGLYQFNVTIPATLSSTGNLPLAIGTLNAFHDQVYIPVQ